MIRASRGSWVLTGHKLSVRPQAGKATSENTDYPNRADYGRGVQLGAKHEFAAWLFHRSKTFSDAMPEPFNAMPEPFKLVRAAL